MDSITELQVRLEVELEEVLKRIRGKAFDRDNSKPELCDLELRPDLHKIVHLSRIYRGINVYSTKETP